jgi:predicted nucleic acid-binding Zn ribbon protein
MDKQAEELTPMYDVNCAECGVWFTQDRVPQYGEQVFCDACQAALRAMLYSVDEEIPCRE